MHVLYLSYNYMTMLKPRKLKIHAKSQARAYSWITIPEIRLEGKWLDKLGFKQGKRVTIEPKRNKLIITVEKGQKK